ncbi:MAG TPA: hypothetical protein VKW08_07675 [Xanthobacteraceae bacterium]|nr:hypothetical protein [Xanthobacteraceae bacterium]
MKYAISCLIVLIAIPASGQQVSHSGRPVDAGEICAVVPNSTAIPRVCGGVIGGNMFVFHVPYACWSDFEKEAPNANIVPCGKDDYEALQYWTDHSAEFLK